MRQVNTLSTQGKQNKGRNADIRLSTHFCGPRSWGNVGEMCVCECVGECGEVMRRSDTARTDDKRILSSENVC